jgi:hypothetical protein
MTLLASVYCAEPDSACVRKEFISDNYTVTWGDAGTFESAAELEIGEGYGHGFTLDWLRFQPRKDHIDVLSIKLKEESQPYRSKWPPDRAPVVISRAQMKSIAYAALRIPTSDPGPSPPGYERIFGGSCG